MKIGTALIGTTLLASVFFADAALASPGYVSRNANLRAGPDTTYPIVDRLRAGENVEIFGCLNEWSWCEIGTPGGRGWISGGYLQAMNDHRRVYIGQAGPVMNVPIISFQLDSYWDDHYRDKPFYHDRGKWSHGKGNKHAKHDDKNKHDYDHDDDHDHGNNGHGHR